MESERDYRMWLKRKTDRKRWRAERKELRQMKRRYYLDKLKGEE